MRSVRIPDNWGYFFNSPFAQTKTMNSTVTPSRYGFLFIAPEAFTCTSIGIRQGTLTGTPGTMRIGMQGVNTSGAPNGTYLATVSGGAATAYVDYTSWSTANNSKFIFVTLPTGGVSLTRGQIVYVTVQCQTGTWDASNNVTVTTDWNSPHGKMEKTGRKASDGSLQNNDGGSPFCLRSSTLTYGYPIETAANTQSINLNSTPDEIGLAFTIPNTYPINMAVRGVTFWLSRNGNGSAKFILYEGTTVLQDVTIDMDISNGDYGAHTIYFDEATLSTLSTNTEYVIAVQPTDTTNQGIAYVTMPADTDISAFTDWTMKYYTRTNGGSWSQTTGRFPCVQLIFDTVGSSGSSGGLIVHPGMTGGMRG